MTPEAALEQHQYLANLRDNLHTAIDRLPPMSAEVVSRHKLEGQSMGTIAADLGIAPATARVRAHRGYRKLGVLLGESRVCE